MIRRLLGLPRDIANMWGWRIMRSKRPAFWFGVWHFVGDAALALCWFAVGVSEITGWSLAIMALAFYATFRRSRDFTALLDNASAALNEKGNGDE